MFFVVRIVIQIIVQFDVVEIVFAVKFELLFFFSGFKAEKERTERFESPFEGIGLFVARKPEAFTGHGIETGGEAPFAVDVDGGLNGFSGFIDDEIVGRFIPDSLGDAEMF